MKKLTTLLATALVGTTLTAGAYAQDTLALADELWAKHRLVVAPGEYFGPPGHVRIGFGGDAGELDAGLARLRAALASRHGRSAHN